MKQAPAILRCAAAVLVRAPRYWRQGRNAPWRAKSKGFRHRFAPEQVERLAAAGFVEIDPRGRWARLTDAGRRVLEAAR